RGNNIQVGGNGNFNQQHYQLMGNCPQLYTPEFFLPKDYVNGIRAEIEAARSKPQK
ncbi:hypothetical protein FA15DRAFT_605494, partial [Coprinopsis marcescibilis]